MYTLIISRLIVLPIKSTASIIICRYYITSICYALGICASPSKSYASMLSPKMRVRLRRWGLWVMVRALTKGPESQPVPHAVRTEDKFSDLETGTLSQPGIQFVSISRPGRNNFPLFISHVSVFC